MDVKESSQGAVLEKWVLDVIAKLEDGAHHPEVWQQLADFRAPQHQELLTQIITYLSQLLSIPQSPQALLLITTLEAVCVAFAGNESLAIKELQDLIQQQPNSELVKGALQYIEQHITTSQFSPDPLLKCLSEFVAMQGTVNTAILTKLQKLESDVQRAKIENIVYMQQQLHDINQTLQMVARRVVNRKNHKVRCVFLVSFYQAWNTLAHVYNEMQKSDDFEPIVVSTSRKKTKDTQVILGEDEVHAFLEQAGIPHIRLNTALNDNKCLDILKAMEPDIIFRQSAYHDLPPVFNAEDINFARLCYIPYSFTAVRRVGKQEAEDAVSSRAHTDLYYHRLCWRIFCETEMHKSMYVDNSVRAGHNVVVTGYPKFDCLLADRQRPAFWPIEQNSQSGKSRFRIIWAPHHSVTRDVMGFGTFVETHQEMLEWARHSQNEFEFVLKPHPALVSEMVHTLKAYSQEYMDTFFATWNALPNTAVFEGGDYGPLFKASDLMLTDGVGFLSEYQIFEKPLIFIDSGRHFGFNAAGTVMMESANKVKMVAEARALCENLRQGHPDPMRTMQQQVLSRIMPYPGQSAQKVLQAIREGLIAEGVID